MPAKPRSLTFRQHDPDVATGGRKHEMRHPSANFTDYGDPVLQREIITLSATDIGERDIACCRKPFSQHRAFIRCWRSPESCVSPFACAEDQEIEQSAIVVSNGLQRCCEF